MRLTLWLLIGLTLSAGEIDRWMLAAHNAVRARLDLPPLEPMRRFTCRGCHARAAWPGYVVRMLKGELHFCSELCAPPFLREGFEMPNLYGDPRG